jgi:precorrin-2 dehydrogenase/sirohydrochlorin ferrochelatase
LQRKRRGYFPSPFSTKKLSTYTMYPLFLDLAGRLVVVIGGGAVGRRKAAALLAAGAHVRLVCLEPRPAEMDDPVLEWLQTSYVAEHLAGAVLVFAAASVEINARVVTDARARGVWVNAASGPEPGDFQVPATVRRGDLVVAIGTGGAAPAVAAALRRRLEAELDETFASWVRLLSDMRSLARDRIADQERRSGVMRRLCDWTWLERLRREGERPVREAMRAEVERG